MKRSSIFMVSVLLCLLSLIYLPQNILCSRADALQTPEFQWKLPSSTEEFMWPIAVAVDSAGNIYVADFCNHMVKKYDPSGQFIKKWGNFGSGDGQFNFPAGIAIDDNDYIYVADVFNYRIQKFNSDGAFIVSIWEKNPRL